MRSAYLPGELVHAELDLFHGDGVEHLVEARVVRVADEDELPVDVW